MGFTSGFLGGITLTYSVIYLSVYVHRQNRTYQSTLLRQQAHLLNSKIDPVEPEYEPPTYRIEQAGLEEQFKDRWNREVENLVHKAQTTDWEAERIKWENRFSNAFNNVRNTEAVQNAEEKIKQTVQEGSADALQAAKDTGEKIKQTVQEGSADALQAAKNAGEKIKQTVQGGGANAVQAAKNAAIGDDKRLLEVKI